MNGDLDIFLKKVLTCGDSCKTSSSAIPHFFGEKKDVSEIPQKQVLSIVKKQVIFLFLAMASTLFFEATSGRVVQLEFR